MWYGFNVLWFFSAGGPNPEISPEKIKIDENDLDFMAEMGCNFVRVPTDYRYFVHDFDLGFITNPKNGRVKGLNEVSLDRTYYGNYDETYLKLLDRAVEAIVSRGLHCSLNVHRGPGYCINGNEWEKHNLWQDKIAQDAFTELWAHFAERYKKYSKDQLSFDLLNEPPAPGQYGLTREIHKDVMARVAGEIRKISPERTIICDGLCGGHVAAPELSDLNVVMSGRGYMPMRLTHWKAEWMQKNGSFDWEYPQWPGMECDGRKWCREELLDFYKPWKEMADAENIVHIGECGCYNKVSNETALAWYKDFFSVMNELNFGYALWNFRGPFGIAEHGREGTNWEVKNGIKFDKDLYKLFVEGMKK